MQPFENFALVFDKKFDLVFFIQCSDVRISVLFKFIPSRACSVKKFCFDSSYCLLQKRKYSICLEFENGHSDQSKNIVHVALNSLFWDEFAEYTLFAWILICQYCVQLQ